MDSKEVKLATGPAVVAAMALAAGIIVSPGCGSDETGDADPPSAGAGSSGTSSGDTGTSSSSGGEGGPSGAIKTVFLIVMENHSWSTIKGNSNATFINSLASESAHAEQYVTPPGLHPSEPNYIWMEAGDNLGITTDDDPDKNHKAEKDHLTTQLEAAGVSWKTYAQSIPDATVCPLKSSGATGKYGVKHIPQLYFDDVTDTNSATSKHCIDHIRPIAELDGDIADPSKTPRYVFIVPDLCSDMHGSLNLECPIINDGANIKKGDTFLKDLVPKLQASSAYKDGGVIFIAWDEGDEGPLPGSKASDGPMPFFAIGNMVKTNYTMNTKIDHSALLRTVQTIFKAPYLRGATTSTDLSEMFVTFP